MNVQLEVDARRLMCPLPVIRLQDCLNQQTPGTEVSITCTDPGTQNDIPAWCRINGHHIVSSTQQQYEYVFVVRKGNDAS
jgi:TusA-related sulfurtransferase